MRNLEPSHICYIPSLRKRNDWILADVSESNECIQPVGNRLADKNERAHLDYYVPGQDFLKRLTDTKVDLKVGVY